MAAAWHCQNIYFDPYQTVICPIKGKIKWNIQKPYLPPQKIRRKRKDKGWESIDFFKNKKQKLNEHPDDMLALWQPSYGGAVASVVSIFGCPPREEPDQTPSPMLQFLINSSQMSYRDFKSDLELTIIKLSELTLEDQPRPICEVHDSKSNKKLDESDLLENIIYDFDKLNNSELDDSDLKNSTVTSVPEFWEFCYKKTPKFG